MKVRITISLDSSISNEINSLKSTTKRVLRLLIESALTQPQFVVQENVAGLATQLSDRSDKSVSRALTELIKKQFIVKKPCFDEYGRKLGNFYFIRAEILDKNLSYKI